MPETIPKEAPVPRSVGGGEDASEAGGNGCSGEPALADRLFELIARFRRPRPLGPPRDAAHEEQHRQKHGQMRMLIALGHVGPLTVQDLARVLEVSPPTASVLAKKAFEEGLVVRRRDANDSRVVWLDLAEAGREHLRVHRQDRIRRFEQLIDAHPELDRAEIARAVEIMLQLFDHDPRADGPQPDGMCKAPSASNSDTASRNG